MKLYNFVIYLFDKKNFLIEQAKSKELEMQKSNYKHITINNWTDYDYFINTNKF